MERLAIYNLLAYRFPAEAAEKVVRDLWMEIVEGKSELWEGIGEDKKECIRGEWSHFFPFIKAFADRHMIWFG